MPPRRLVMNSLYKMNSGPMARLDEFILPGKQQSHGMNSPGAYRPSVLAMETTGTRLGRVGVEFQNPEDVIITRRVG